MKKRKGFTLVELLVVISIIAVLMSMLMPALNKAKEQAKKVWCQANMRGTMLTTRTYVLGNQDYLPFSGRNFTQMGMLDWALMLQSEGLELRKLHCPADIYKPGQIAWWYRDTLGRTMTEADHWDRDNDSLGDVPVGVEPEVDYSYYWFFKMYMNVIPATHAGAKLGDLQVGGGYKSWRLSDVKYPSRLATIGSLITLEGYMGGVDEYPWPHTSKKAKGYMFGFLDGHSDFYYANEIDIARQELWNNGQPVYDDPDLINPDWTPGGIKGWDVK